MLYQSLGVLAFAVMKSTAMILSTLYTYFVMFYLMKESGWHFILKLIKMYVVPTVLFVVACYIVEPYMMFEKGRDYLMVNIIIIAGLNVVGCSIYFMLSPFVRNEIIKIVIKDWK